MEKLLDEYRQQKDLIDKKIEKLSSLPPSLQRNKDLLLARQIQYDLAIAVKEIEQYVLLG